MNPATSQKTRYLCGILGYPLGHSLSPMLHGWGFAQTGHCGAYFAWQKTAEQLPEAIRAIRCLSVTGVSVTLPHKEAVIAHLDGLTPRAQSVGAVNTLFLKDNLLLGDNTDMLGFLAPLADRTIPAALVLGAGGVARAVLAGLALAKVKNITLAARDIHRAASLAGDIPCRIIPWEERVAALHSMQEGLIVNTTPLGMQGEQEKESPIPGKAWMRCMQPSALTAYDLVYTPLTTVFLQDAAKAGVAVQNGLDCFIGQGLEQFRIWTGISLPATEARIFLMNKTSKQASVVLREIDGVQSE